MTSRARTLIAIARHAIEERFLRSAPPAVVEPMDERRGVFVTLRRRPDDDLRGCVGMIEPRFALPEAVRKAAISAAFEDPRFPPVSRAELPAIAIDVSVLGPLAASLCDAVEIGRHGVVVHHEGRSALLLPEVATEQGWDRETLLRQLCRKAALPPDAWRDPACRLFVFETETYSED